MPTSTTTTTTTTTTTVPPTSSAFCSIWKIRHPKGPDGLPGPAPKPYIYDLDADTVVHARSVEQRGTDCQDPAARIQMFDGEIIGRDLYFPANNSIDGPQLKATPYSQTLAPGQAQTPTVEIASLNIELSLQGIRIYGSLRITINGAVSIVTFDGTYLDLQNFSVVIDAPALALPGLATRPVSAKGSLIRQGGLNDISFDARVPDLTVGDLTVADAAVELHATTTTGLTAQIQGTVNTAGNQASLALAASFDATGQLQSIDGRLSVALSARQADGQLVTLNGDVSLSGQASHIVASFSGSGSIGADSLTRAAGRLEINANGVVTLDGVFDLRTGGTTLHLEGAIIYDGSQAIPTLSAVAAGTYSGVTAAGEIVELRGNVTITNVGGTFTTTVDGDLRIGTLRGSAHAVVAVAGSTTSLAIDGSIVSGSLNAAVTGSLVVNNGSVSSLLLSGRLNQPAQIGGISLSGSVTVTGDVNGLAFDISGSCTGPGLSVAGSALVVTDAGGNLSGVRASVSGAISGGDWSIAGFSGSLVADATTTVVSGFGLVTGSKVNFGQASGTLLIVNGVGQLNLQGQVSVTSERKTVFGDFAIVDNELTMARVGVVYPPILIDPERVWVRLRLGAGGKCTNIEVLDATFLIGLITGGFVAADDLGCPRP